MVKSALGEYMKRKARAKKVKKRTGLGREEKWYSKREKEERKEVIRFLNVDRKVMWQDCTK